MGTCKQVHKLNSSWILRIILVKHTLQDLRRLWRSAFFCSNWVSWQIKRDNCCSTDHGFLANWRQICSHKDTQTFWDSDVCDRWISPVLKSAQCDDDVQIFYLISIKGNIREKCLWPQKRYETWNYEAWFYKQNEDGTLKPKASCGFSNWCFFRNNSNCIEPFHN